MSVYMTEEEQLESIKKWWKRYGNLITVCLSIVLLCIAGVRYFHWHQAKISQQASVTYERMMMEFSNQNNKAVRSYANQLISEYKSSVYADVAHMTLAKIYIAKNKLKPAIAELNIVKTTSKMPALKQVAKIRIARIMAAEKSYDTALAELNAIEDKAYSPVINELKGDIYSATGQYKDAMSSYQLAIDEAKTHGIGNLFLEMKNNELAIKNQSLSSETKKIQSA